MEGSDISMQSLRTLNAGQRLAELKQDNARPIVKRLWESYLNDLTETLEAFNTGVISEDELHPEIQRIVPILQHLRADGKFAEALKRAEIVILEKVLEDVGT